MSERQLTWPELLAKLQAGPKDELAWEEAWRRLEIYARGLLRSGQSIESASAEDIIQQTLAKFLESSEGLAKLDPALNPEAYLKAAIRNSARDLARRKVLALKALRQLAQERLRAQLAADQPSESIVMLLEELERLPKEKQDLLRMRFWEGLSLREIALRLGEPYSRVAVRLFRVLKELRNRLPG